MVSSIELDHHLSDRVGFRRIARACRFIRDDILGVDTKYLGAWRSTTSSEERFTCTIHSCETYALVKRPLIRLRHLLPQLKSAGGEGLSIKEYRISERGSRKCKDHKLLTMNSRISKSLGGPLPDVDASLPRFQDSLSVFPEGASYLRLRRSVEDRLTLPRAFSGGEGSRRVTEWRRFQSDCEQCGRNSATCQPRDPTTARPRDRARTAPTP